MTFISKDSSLATLSIQNPKVDLPDPGSPENPIIIGLLTEMEVMLF